MKIKIENDPFNITKRIKQLNKNYFIVFDTLKQKFEIHTKEQKNSYCITVPYNQLDCRVIELLRKSEKYDEVFQEIETFNKKLEDKNKNALNDKTTYQLKEIYEYANKHVKNFDCNAYKNVWI